MQNVLVLFVDVLLDILYIIRYIISVLNENSNIVTEFLLVFLKIWKASLCTI